jgi:DNA-directed RNA polymerase subunit RPC12/RpoP
LCNLACIECGEIVKDKLLPDGYSKGEVIDEYECPKCGGFMENIESDDEDTPNDLL